MNLRRLPDRFLEKVLVPASPDGCWEWSASKTRAGYGLFWRDGRPQLVHRVAYELLVGEIPARLQLDHLCRVRHCANPGHLQPVTQRENILRGGSPAARNAVKTCCPRGHEYSGENTYTRPSGKRDCRECKRDALRHYRVRRRARSAQAVLTDTEERKI